MQSYYIILFLTPYSVKVLFYFQHSKQRSLTGMLHGGVFFSGWRWTFVSHAMSSGSVHGHPSARKKITPFQQEAEITRLTLRVMQSCMLHLCYLFAVLVNSRKDYTEKLYLGLLVCVSIQDILSGAIDLCPYCSNTVPRRT